jgi:hypothetical protein
MVLKGPDYGFIGVKLKGLIFYECGKWEIRRAVNIHNLGREICKKMQTALGYQF